MPAGPVLKVPVPGPDGVTGASDDVRAPAVSGTNRVSGATGFLGGQDSLFHQHVGVFGESEQQGVFGSGKDVGTGVYGTGKFGVRGEVKDGVAAIQGQSFGTGLAGSFIGLVRVQGNVEAQDVKVTGADCAEFFRTLPGVQADAGMVMVIEREGDLAPCTKAYDSHVAGVISGAGTCRPGLTLGANAEGEGHSLIALSGKVYCKVDANYAAIAVGDLLTTSPTLGHAMKATDSARAFGSIIGKALGGLEAGLGLVPIIVSLQ